MGSEKTNGDLESEVASPSLTVLVLGSRPVWREINGVNQVVLSLDGKMRCIATLELFEKDPNIQIILCGGRTRAADQLSEAELMKDYLMRRGVPQKQISLEDESKDTIENFEHAKEKLSPDGPPIVVLSNQYHLPRVQEIMGQLNFASTFQDAEALLNARGSHHRLFVEKYNGSIDMLRKQFIERIARTLLWFGPKGREIQKAVSRKLRG